MAVQVDLEQLIPGLESPGPIYVLPSCFDRAAVKSKHPTWGHRAPESLKSARYREDEVRFTGHRQMREMLGHFSPGPQYSLPPTLGGATGNANAASERVAGTAPASSTFTDLSAAAMPYTSLISGDMSNGRGTAKLNATQLGGTANYVLTRGSFADHQRWGGTEPLKDNTDFWRSATMLQSEELNFHNAGQHPRQAQPWHRTQEQAHDTREQDSIKHSLHDRCRPDPLQPRRQVRDYRADPPLANVFGSAHAHSDFGTIGGLERNWRESKVSGYTSTAPKWGPSTGAMRHAFVQKHGPNSVPSGASKANFDGGRPDLRTSDGRMARTNAHN